MNYNININQRAIIENGFDIDIVDAAILTGIKNMFSSPKTRTMQENGAVYFWVSASKLSKDLPLIRLKKQAIVKRLTKLIEKKLIVRHQDNASMGMSFYSGGENWDILFSMQPTTKTQTEHTTVHTPYVSGYTPPMYDGTHYPNTNNPNTNNPKEKEEEKTSSTHTNNSINSISFEKGNQEVQPLEAEKKERKSSAKKKEDPYLNYYSEKNHGIVTIPEKLDTPEFITQWERYKRYRYAGKTKKGLKFTYTDAESESDKLTEIANKYTLNQAIEAIKRNINEGWECYLPRIETNNKAKGKIVALDSDYQAPEQDPDFWKTCGL